MSDFGSKVRQAAKEVAAKKTSPQKKRTLPIPAGAPYGYKKDGTVRKRPANPGTWEKGVAASPDTVWKPGVSANPGGRPSMKPFTDAMKLYGSQPYAGKEVRFKGMTNLQVMVAKQFDLAIDNGDMRAATEIMDRVEGKTVQVQQHQGPHGGAINFTTLTPEENERQIAELEALARGEATTEE